MLNDDYIFYDMPVYYKYDDNNTCLQVVDKFISNDNLRVKDHYKAFSYEVFYDYLKHLQHLPFNNNEQQILTDEILAILILDYPNGAPIINAIADAIYYFNMDEHNYDYIDKHVYMMVRNKMKDENIYDSNNVCNPFMLPFILMANCKKDMETIMSIFNNANNTNNAFNMTDFLIISKSMKAYENKSSLNNDYIIMLAIINMINEMPYIMSSMIYKMPCRDNMIKGIVRQFMLHSKQVMLAYYENDNDMDALCDFNATASDYKRAYMLFSNDKMIHRMKTKMKMKYFTNHDCMNDLFSDILCFENFIDTIRGKGRTIFDFIPKQLITNDNTSYDYFMSVMKIMIKIDNIMSDYTNDNGDKIRKYASMINTYNVNNSNMQYKNTIINISIMLTINDFINVINQMNDDNAIMNDYSSEYYDETFKTLVLNIVDDKLSAYSEIVE